MKSQIQISQEIIHQVCIGDTQAFRSVVNQLMQPAYFHALALLHDHDDAVEVSQETFYKVWKSRKSIDPTKPFYPWFYTILKRLCLNVHRDKARRKETAISKIGSWIEPVSLDDSSDRIIMSEQHTMVQKALEHLSVEDREIIVLKDLEGFSYKEIAETLSIPIGTVMSRLYTARKRFKSFIERIGYEHGK